MRRVAQSFVISTKTSIDVPGLEIPEHITDSYFKKAKKPGDKSKAGIFATTEETVLHCYVFISFQLYSIVAIGYFILFCRFGLGVPSN